MLTEHIKKYFAHDETFRKSRFRLFLVGTCLCAGLTYADTKVDNSVLASIPQTIDDSQPASMLPEYVVIQASDQVTYSSETSASVASIAVKEGSSFHAGDVLLMLDCRVQQADLDKAKAQKAVSDLGYASAKKLKNYEAISGLEYLQAQSQRDMANADVDKLMAIVEKCTIKAPFNGSVAKVMVHIFETVKPGDPLLKIVSTEDLDFILQVPSNWLAWLHVGTPFTVHVNELNKTVSVKVVKIDPEIDSVSQTVKVIGKLVEADSALLPGMSGQASFPDMPVNINKAKLKLK